jgi:hypothetical protein
MVSRWSMGVKQLVERKKSDQLGCFACDSVLKAYHSFVLRRIQLHQIQRYCDYFK